MDFDPNVVKLTWKANKALWEANKALVSLFMIWVARMVFAQLWRYYGLAAFLDTTNGQILALWQGVGQLHFGMPGGFRG